MRIGDMGQKMAGFRYPFDNPHDNSHALRAAGRGMARLPTRDG